jgi:hypothetical protein
LVWDEADATAEQLRHFWKQFDTPAEAEQHAWEQIELRLRENNL